MKLTLHEIKLQSEISEKMRQNTFGEDNNQ